MMDKTLEYLASELNRFSEFELNVSGKMNLDSIGSVYALAIGLQSLEKGCYISTTENVPTKYQILLSDYCQDEVINPVSVMLDIVKSGHSEEDVGREMKFCIRGKGVMNTEWRIMNPEVSSGCEIVFKLLKLLNAKITPGMANLLYAGIVEETRRFCTRSLGAETLRIASELIDCGAHAYELSRRYSFTKDLKDMAAQLKMNGDSEIISLQADIPCFSERLEKIPQWIGTFVNCSNHPSAEWSREQRMAAEQIGPLMDVPFPMVPGDASVELIRTMADELVDQIIRLHPKAVMCQGEFTLTFATVSRLQEAGVVCVSASAVRNTVEKVLPDGTTSKQSIFKFAGFRPYDFM